MRNPDDSVSPFGGATYRYSSEFFTTFAQCDAYALELLPRVSRIRGVTRDVTEPFVLGAISRKLAFICDPFGNLIELAEVLS